MSRQKADAVRELAQPVGKLAVHAALVLVRVPTADVGKGGFEAEVGLEQLGNLLHVVGEAVIRIVGVGRGLIVGGVGGAQHLDRFKGGVAGRVEQGIAGLVVHGFERRGRGSWLRTAPANGEILHIADGQGGNASGEGSRDIRA
jgi:hypothetical protein